MAASEIIKEERMSKFNFKWKNSSSIEDRIKAEILEHNNVLQGILDERKTIAPAVAEERSKKKYFKAPKMKDDHGTPHDGWGNILGFLKEKDGKAKIKDVDVDIEFNLIDPNAENDTDLIIQIKTKFAIESETVKLDPVIEGSLFHRRICDLEP